MYALSIIVFNLAGNRKQCQHHAGVSIRDDMLYWRETGRPFSTEDGIEDLVACLLILYVGCRDGRLVFPDVGERGFGPDWDAGGL